MKSIIFVSAIGAFVLASCNRPVDASNTSQARGRYAAAGIYPAGRMWAQMGAPAGKDAATARLGDDEQIVVTVDSQTGELRQCGNMSGYCVGLNPWAKPVAASAPLAVAKHADQLDSEARSKLAEPAPQH